MISEFIDDDDEILLALCEELPNLLPGLGGIEHAAVLLRPLESLAAVEESTVRDKAIAAIQALVAQLSPAAIDTAARCAHPTPRIFPSTPRGCDFLLF